jgi:uncharacterized protein
MIGLDCNILVQLAIADHPANARTIAAVQAETARDEKVVFPQLVATEFLHVVTDARRFSPPLTMTEAIDWIEDFLSKPSVATVKPTDASFSQTLRWMREFNLGRKRILDTHLAAVLHTNGINRLLTSNPADFAIFTVLQSVAP